MASAKKYLRLNDRSALISGAASGIGKATALLFAQHGAKVAVCDINLTAAAATVREIEAAGGTAIALQLDVTSEADWTAAIEKLLASWDRLDILVNCAGITDDAPIVELSLEQFRRVLTVNLEGTFLGTRAAMRAMATAGKGTIINVSSASGVRASPGASAYAASKAAVIHFTRTAALECAQANHNIRVNCVVPGGVKTPMWETTAHWPQIASTESWTAPADSAPLNRFAEPAEIANAILFLACDESSFVSGSALIVDGGHTA